MLTRIIACVLVVLLLATACSPGVAEPVPSPVIAPKTTVVATPNSVVPTLSPAPTPREIAFGRSYVDVHYCNDGATPLKMIVVAPKEPTAGPAPVLLHLKFMPELIPLLVERGFIVANVDWREPPAYKLPIGVHDVKCAIRYLRANASLYNLDPQRIGVFGCSRGGHLAALIGVTDSSANMEGGSDFAGQSSRVGAVVTFDGIANFKTNYADAAGELESVHGITSFDDPLVAQLSPITHVTANDPPFLILHSPTEWKDQAIEMQASLQTVGVSAEVVELENSSHCRLGASGPHVLEGTVNLIADFFDRTLR